MTWLLEKAHGPKLDVDVFLVIQKRGWRPMVRPRHPIAIRSTKTSVSDNVSTCRDTYPHYCTTMNIWFSILTIHYYTRIAMRTGDGN
jgi:hypothetical protein